MRGLECDRGWGLCTALGCRVWAGNRARGIRLGISSCVGCLPGRWGLPLEMQMLWRGCAQCTTDIFRVRRSSPTWRQRQLMRWRFWDLPATTKIFLGRFKDAATPQEERRYMSLLGSFPGEGEMRNTLEMCLNGDVRSQDAPYLAGGCDVQSSPWFLGVGVHQIALGRNARDVPGQQHRADGEWGPRRFRNRSRLRT